MIGECPGADLLRAMLDGVCSAAEQERLDAHIEECAGCQRSLDRLTCYTELFPSVGPGAIPTGLLGGSLLDGRNEAGVTTEPGDAGAPPTVPGPGRAWAPWPEVPGYVILGVLGHGGMGVVYRARSRSLNRPVALKMIRPGVAASPEQVIRFRVEGETLARLRHPNIVQIYEFGTHDGLQYAAMEYIAGGSLDAALAAGPPPPSQAAWLVEVLARAIHNAHQAGIIHRDLKPANILLDARPAGDSSTEGPGDSAAPDPAPWNPKVSDFGLAKQHGSGMKLTQSGVLAGTPAYMAPEQIRGGDRVGPPADIYGLGAILFEILTGRPPFEGATAAEVIERVLHRDPDPPGRLRPGVPRDLATICLKCLEREASRRYGSALELADDLLRFRSGRPIAARHAGPVERASKWARRHPAVACLTLAVVASMLMGTACSLAFAIRAGQLAATARRNETEATGARRESDRLAASLLVRSGIEQAQRGQVARGLFTLLDAWRTLPPEEVATRRVIRTNLAAWGRELPVLTGIRTWGETDRRGKWMVDQAGETIVSIVDGTILRWDARSGRPLGLPARLPEPLASWPFAGPPAQDEPDRARTADPPALSADGTLLALGVGGRCYLVETAEGRLVAGPIDDPHRGKRFAAGDRLLITTPRQQPELGGSRRCWLLDVRDRTGRILPAAFDDEVGVGHTVFAGLDEGGRPVAAFVPSLWVGEDRPRAEVQFRDVATGDRIGPPRRLVATGVGFLWGDGVGLSLQHVPSVLLMGWDTDVGRLRGAPWGSRHSGLSGLTDDGQCVYGVDEEQRFRLFDVDTGLQRGGDLPLADPLARRQRIVLRPNGDGSRVRIFAADGTIRDWRPGAGLLASSAASPRPKPHPDAPRSVDFAQTAIDPGSGTVILCDADLDLGIVVDARTGRSAGPPLRTDVALPTISPDGLWVASVASARHPRDPFLHIRGVATGEERIPALRLPRYTYALAFSPDGRALAVGCVGVTLLVDPATGRIRHLLQEQTTAARMAFSPDGRRLVIAYQTGWPGVGAGLRLWDVASGRPIGPFRPWSPGAAGIRNGRPELLAFSDDGARLTAVLPDHLCTYDGKTGEPLDAPRYLGSASAAALSPDHSRVAVGSGSGVVQQWDLASAERLGPPMETGATVSLLRHSPDGRTLAIASRDRTARLWDSDTGLPVGPPFRGRSQISGLEFTADGGALIVATADGEVRTRLLPTPVADDLDQIGLSLRVASGMDVVEGRTTLLDAEAWESLRTTLAAKRLATKSPFRLDEEEAARHDERARDAEFGGNPYAALWHLERLASLRPDDWFPQARRFTLFSILSDEVAARRAYAAAADVAESEGFLGLVNHLKQAEATCDAMELRDAARVLRDRLPGTGADD